MGLRLIKELSNGLTVEYHRVAEFNTNDQGCLITLYQYSNKEDRDAGKTPVVIEPVEVSTLVDSESTETDLIKKLKADCYATLKANGWENAEDC